MRPRMQRVAVPNLWPRMRNVVDGSNDAVATEEKRDLREEARREVEEERRDRDREGLRWRGGGGEGDRRGYDMPGSMPGMLVT